MIFPSFPMDFGLEEGGNAAVSQRRTLELRRAEGRDDGAQWSSQCLPGQTGPREDVDIGTPSR